MPVFIRYGTGNSYPANYGQIVKFVLVKKKSDIQN